MSTPKIIKIKNLSKTTVILLALTVGMVSYNNAEEIDSTNGLKIESGVIKKTDELKSKSASNFENYIIQYFDGSEYVEISEKQYQHFLVEEVGIPSESAFQPTNVEEYVFENDTVKRLNTKIEASGTYYSVTTLLSHISGQDINSLALDKSTCSCESEDCSWNGCEVTSAAGSGCSCSSCDGKCKKTHTVTSDYSAYMF